MPWTKRDHPDSMKNLPKGVRDKAIEIGNALLEDKRMGEGIAIATAISRAKDWAANRGKKTENRSRVSRTTDLKSHGNDRYVIPYDEHKWAVKNEGSKRVEKVFDHKKDAVQQAERKRANQMLHSRFKNGMEEYSSGYLTIRIEERKN